MKVLLDPCTFLWLAQRPDRISETGASIINDEGNEHLVSEVSVMEIAMKHSAGKLPLPGSSGSFWSTAGGSGH